MQPIQTIFTPLLIASLTLFFWSCYQRLSLVALGREDHRFNNPLRFLPLLYDHVRRRPQRRWNQPDQG